MDTIRRLTASGGASQEGGDKMALHSAKEGYLRKKGGTLGNWASRYFVLFHHKCQYFVNRHKGETGEFLIYSSTTVEIGSDPCVFTVNPIPADPNTKSYVLAARDQVRHANTRNKHTKKT
jgi:hypothetical protein